MDNSAPPMRRTLNVWPDAATILGVSRSKAYEMARSGELPVIRMGRRLVVPMARLERLLGESDE
ncbi:MAG: helix-turn-helix domain-containing protein [Alphaproteobacteria bacterium]|nr:helix-turn-helix domain-containing protein [Alphaproteobacteria bacterium]